jgi:hypothetical protein
MNPVRTGVTVRCNEKAQKKLGGSQVPRGLKTPSFTVFGARIFIFK